MNKIFFVLLISLICCSPKDEQQIIKISKTVEIPLPALGLSTYNCQQVYTSSNIVYYAGYNFINHTIDIFNLSSQKYVESVPLQKEGPNGFKSVNGFKVLSDSSIMIANNDELAWVNYFGEKYKSLNLTEIIDNSSLGNIFIDFRSQNDLIFDEEKGTLLVHTREAADYSSESFFTHAILGEIDINRQTIAESDIFFPSIFNDFFYGDHSFPMISSQSGYDIISFPVTETFYIREKENWRLVGSNDNSKSTITKPISKDKFIDSKTRIDYVYNSTYFGRMNFLSSINKYCRVHLYKYSDEGIGQRRIEVFNNDLEIEYVYNLENNHAINYFISGKSIYLNRMNEKESYLIFDEITFK